MADVTATIEQQRRKYGGSYRAAPSFLHPAYVVHNSISKSRDLGTYTSGVIELKGVIGSQAGTNTLFFDLRIPEPVKLGFCRVAGNRWEDQHVALNVYDADSRLVNYDHGTLGWNQGVFRTGSEVTIQALDPYVTPSYWDPQGYTENDYGTTTIIREVVTEPSIRILGEPVPAGRYRFTISTNQWTAIPFHCRIVVQANVELSGLASGSSDTTGSSVLALSRYVALDYWVQYYAVDAEAPPVLMLMGFGFGAGFAFLEEVVTGGALVGLASSAGTGVLDLRSAPPPAPSLGLSGVAAGAGTVFFSPTLE